MRPREGQVVTVVRNVLRPDAEPAYGEELAVVAALARASPGFVETKTFTADDGERCTVVTFADEASHRAWREHPRHREAQRRAPGFYAQWSIAVGSTTYAAADGA